MNAERSYVGFESESRCLITMHDNRNVIKSNFEMPINIASNYNSQHTKPIFISREIDFSIRVRREGRGRLWGRRAKLKRSFIAFDGIGIREIN